MHKYLFLILSFFISTLNSFAQVDTAWVRRYNGPVNSSDLASALTVDDKGNVYVTGYSWSGTMYDYATIKYSSKGDTLWVRRFNGSGNDWDIPTAMEVDSNGNVYVTGYSSNGVSYSYATIKYSTNGKNLWVRYFKGQTNNDDKAYALALDRIGNVYVVGYTVRLTTSGDFTIIKYTPNGDTLWARYYDGPGNLDDVAKAVALDREGNACVTGYSWSGTSYDYVTIKYAPNGDTLWVRRYSGPAGSSLDEPSAIVVDSSGNVYVTGVSNGNGNRDYVTLKYAPNGGLLWVARYNGLADSTDVATALAVDDSGNAYVTGYSWNGINNDYATIKYATDGAERWVRLYNGPGNSEDLAWSLAVDWNNNVYVTGNSSGNAVGDYATIKYSTDGDTLWVKRYDGRDNNQDRATALAVDDSAKVYVTGWSTGSETSQDFATIKYVQFNCIAKPGDVDGDSTIQMSDIITIINFLFKGSLAPNPFCRADANADGKVLLSDIVYLINFLFKAGLAPVRHQQCCL